MVLDRSNHASCYNSGYLYVFCGKTTDNTGQFRKQVYTNTIERLQIMLNDDNNYQKNVIWELITLTDDCNIPSTNIFSVALNANEILIMGGSISNSDKFAYTYDIIHGCFRKLSINTPFQYYSSQATNQIAVLEENKIICLAKNCDTEKKVVLTYQKGQNATTLISEDAEQ